MTLTKWGRGRAAVAVAFGLTMAALGGTVPGALAASSSGPLGKITRVGATPSSQPLSLVLPLNTDKAGLARFAAAVSTPGSPQYGQYQSVPALVRRFGAPASERARVERYLRRAGATGVRIDGSGLFADATMSAGLAHRLFGAELTAFRTASATRFTAPTTSISIPAGLAGAVTGVVGLDTRPLTADEPHAGAVHGSAATAMGGSALTGDQEVSSGYNQRTGTAAGCPTALAQSGFTPNQYLTAYGYDGLYSRGITGTGERVALIEINGYKPADVRAYAKCFSRPVPKITNFRVGINKLLKPGGEATLDLEVLDSAAPGLKGIDVYESQARASDVLQTLTRPLLNRGRKPDVISVSLGDCEKDTKLAIGGHNISTVEASLEIATASGISVLASSGDDGSTACVDQRGAPEFQQAVNYPASSRWVTGVGGTNFALNAANRSRPPAGQTSGQIVWNDQDGPPAAATASCSAGRAGRTAPRPRPGGSCPTWRCSPTRLPATSSTARRRGTASARTRATRGSRSAARAPARRCWPAGWRWSTRSCAAAAARTSASPTRCSTELYRSPARAAVFADVTQFNNDYFGLLTDGAHALGCCTARAGFDAASGLGSVNVTNLAASAASIVPKLVSVGLRLPRQSAPVRAEHLLATVSCSGRA